MFDSGLYEVLQARSFLKNLTVSDVVEKFSALYGSLSSITVFTTAITFLYHETEEKKNTLSPIPFL